MMVHGYKLRRPGQEYHKRSSPAWTKVRCLKIVHSVNQLRKLCRVKEVQTIKEIRFNGMIPFMCDSRNNSYLYIVRES